MLSPPWCAYKLTRSRSPCARKSWRVSVLASQVVSTELIPPVCTFSENSSLVRKNLLLSQHVFKAFPFGVAKRLRRNCSEEVFPVKRMAEYKEYLVNQGYPSKLVLEFFKPFTILRNDLLRNRGKETKKLFPFVITFNPN